VHLDENILSKDETAKAEKGQRHFKDEPFDQVLQRWQTTATVVL
jgi:hypothetical protein